MAERASSRAQRIIYGLLAVLVVIAIILVDVAVARTMTDPDALRLSPEATASLGSIAGSPVGRLLAHGSLIPVVLCILMVLSAREMSQLFQQKATRPHILWATLIIVALVLSPWLSAAEWLGHGAHHIEGFYWTVVLLVIGLIGTGLLSVLRRNPENMIHNVGATWIMILSLGFLPSFATQLRCGVDIAEGATRGAWLLLVAVLVIKSSDMGAYLIGSTLGRRKLLPQISPAKSVEGMVGGFLGSTGVALAVAWIGASSFMAREAATVLNADNLPGAGSGRLGSLLYEICHTFGRDMGPGTMPWYVRATIFGLAISATAQVGDLLESGFKRDAGIKDSGRVIPRFGGILDLVDSLVPALPVAWFLLVRQWGIA